MKKLVILLFTVICLYIPNTVLAHSMPDSEMRMGPIAFGTPFSEIEALFGDDCNTQEIYFGNMVFIWHHYHGFSIQARPADDEETELCIATAKITSQSLSTRSGFVKMPCGIGVGSPYSKVVELFGGVPVIRVTGADDAYCFVSNDNPGRMMTFVVDKQGRIKEIRLETEV